MSSLTKALKINIVLGTVEPLVFSFNELMLPAYAVKCMPLRTIMPSYLSILLRLQGVDRAATSLALCLRSTMQSDRKSFMTRRCRTIL
jgi:hypothetical protein